MTRLAPTPSGLLHAGNALSFVLTWALARAGGGRVLLRIDDLDAARVRPEYLANIFATIDWLGIDYDLGPRDMRDYHANWSRDRRMPHYTDLLNRLTGTGRVYACTCSRRELDERRAAGLREDDLYVCRNRNLPLETAGAAWRIRVPEGTRISISTELKLAGVTGSSPESIDLTQEMGDFIVRRQDGVPAYQAASLAEDLHHGMDLIVRGADLLPSTAAQRYLAGLLDDFGASFLAARTVHHPLFLAESGEKLSKSADAAAVLQSNRADIFRQVSEWLGTSKATNGEQLLEAIAANPPTALNTP
ncbi:MAG: glutamate--tRNA ligase family protein [Saprospiraceae bacterium]